MKFVAASASLALLAVASTSAQGSTDAKYFKAEPAEFGTAADEPTSPDAEVYFKSFPGYAPANQTERALAGVTPGQAADAGIAVFTIAQSVAPLLSGMFGEGKKCHQLACWVEAPNYNCQFAAANQVQRELTKGRNSFNVDSSGPTGMWVRYWRTQFTPPDRGDIADGKCGGGSRFKVFNCQQTGKVHC